MPAHLIAEEGPLRGLVLNLEEGEDWIIGRDPDEADFVVEDSTVSRKHARISKTPDGLQIRNLSRVNPTLVNDQEIEGRQKLNEGDRVKIGNTVFLYSEEAVPELSAPRPAGKPKKRAKGGYDDIFGDLEESELPPEPEPVEMAAEMGAPAPSQPETPAEEPKGAERTSYDTIFDDLGAETEMPFNLLAETPLLLKVIGGPNAGAEIGLEKGRTYLLGKDSATSDIVFQDLSVSRNHARMTVTPDGIIELEDLGSKNGTLVNGVPITEKRTVTSQDLIAMGTTVFLIIDREAAQETIYSPLVPVYETPKPPAAEMLAEGMEAAAQEVPLAEKLEEWKKRPIPLKHLIFGGAVLLIFFIAFLGFFSLFKAEQMEISHKAPTEKIKEIIAKYPAVHYSYNPSSGKIFLTGHVLTAVDYQELNYNLDQLPAISGKEDTVVIDELVWKTMNDVLNGNAGWRGVSITSPKAGQFVVHGYVQTNDEATQISEYLTVNFPYLDRLENDIIVEDNLNLQIQGMLQAKGMGAVSYQLSNGELILAGRYSEKQESEYHSLLKELNKLNGVHGVKNFAIASHPSAARIDLSQQYKVTGSAAYDNHGYSVVVNGKIVSIGQSLDGMTITQIDPKSILLEKDGLKYKIDYTR